MAKEKLFTPEDFDKPVDKPWYKKTLTWIIGLVIIALGVGGAFHFFNNPGTEHPPYTDKDTIIITPPPYTDKDTTIIIDPPIQDIDSLKNPDCNNSKETEDTLGASIASESTQEVDTSGPSIKRGETFEVDAKMAIRGDFGNGKIRKQNLGADYQKVQDIVNQFIREKNTKW